MTKSTTRKPADSIFGYELKERIGSGGYGEVWTAEAPGGLQKAIKFIFGFHDGDRAQREMKSLNHIKSVRHPFLLSLERIDIVDGQLVIVTELAEKSLKDRFDECIEQGMRGVPRDELLLYMQEAAEALDYINHQHSLQHLDVKPENLLLASGHVKVADFGLVKQIHDATASLMGGLTPLYAPPELFDGRPTRNSDQYSLAIVYQEMLTGSRPFDGETAAQLAAQHLRGRPRLSKLPRSDRSVIATALSKDPMGRHTDCRTLVRRLHANQFAELAGEATLGKSGSSDTEHVASPDLRSNVPTTGLLRVSPLRRQAVQVKTLPPIAHDATSSAFRPTLVVGLGRTGTLVLQGIRKRLSAHGGARADLPAYSLLAIDTDCQQLRQSLHCENPEAALTPQEILEVPLRTCEDYRERSKVHLSWLSRRWLYNIPRSLLTEGIRPLGRLAFADHVQAIRENLTQTIRRLTDRHLVKQTADKLALRPSDMGPRVIIVSSISGGFGSGCVLDLAYLVRQVLYSLGVPDDALLGVLTFSSQKGTPQDRELMLANTYACLSEYHHYARVGFSADEACQLPELEPDQAAFAQMYLVDLNRHALSRDDHAGLNMVAEYIYQSSSTTCATLLDRCRVRTRDTESRDAKITDTTTMAPGATVSSFGLTAIGGGGQQSWALANRIVDRLLDQWISPRTGASSSGEATAAWREISEQLAFTDQDVFNSAQLIVAKTLEIPDDHEGWLADQARLCLADISPLRTGSHLEVVCDRADDAVKCLDPAASAGRPTIVSTRNRECMQWAATMSHHIAQTLQQSVVSLVDVPTARIHGANGLLSASRHDLEGLANAFRDRQDEVRQKSQEVRAELLRARPEPSKGAEPIVPGLLQTYLRYRLLETVLQVSRAAISTTLQRVVDLTNRLRDIVQQLSRVRERRQDVFASGTDDTHRPSEYLLTQDLQEQCETLVDQLEAKWTSLPADEAQPLSELLFQPSDRGVLRLESRLLSIAQDLLRNALRHSDVSAQLVRRLVEDGDATSELHRRIKHAQPPLVSHGGAKRLVAVSSQTTSEPLIAELAKQHLDEVASVVTQPGGDVVFLYELSQIPLANVSMGLLANHPEAVAFAARLKTRIDVEWSPLTELL